MKKQIALLLFSILLFSGCTAPQYFWPQEDIGFQELNQPTLEKKILIASHNTEFKTNVVNKIKDAFLNKDVYIKISGLENLENEDANQYSAVVLLNTAMGWKADRKVRSFLVRFGKLNHIIVLTTSDTADVTADTGGDRQIDAITSASSKDETEEVANNIINKINTLISR
ncbi:MAG: hypothetical protein HKO79_05150 [Desulfobacterales bacterium]|nr:hypothetical protein [Desulfobacterales bacterium]